MWKLVKLLINDFPEKNLIDEDGNHELTNFNSKKSTGVVKSSDHVTMVLNLNLSYSKQTQNRVEIYNLKNIENQAMFHEVTSCGDSLLKCFENSLPLKVQVKQWENKLKSCIAQAFNKIRISGKKKETEWKSKESKKTNKEKDNFCTEEPHTTKVFSEVWTSALALLN